MAATKRIAFSQGRIQYETGHIAESERVVLDVTLVEDLIDGGLVEMGIDVESVVGQQVNRIHFMPAIPT